MIFTHRIGTRRSGRRGRRRRSMNREAKIVEKVMASVGEKRADMGDVPMYMNVSDFLNRIVFHGRGSNFLVRRRL
jgi:hypothetical protein